MAPERTKAHRSSWSTLPATGAIEALERRLLLSNIVWENRGSSSDRFDSTFGPNAAAARAVVDAAIDHWERVITDFNYKFISELDLTIRMAAGGTGFGGSTNVDGADIGTGSPGSATTTLGPRQRYDWRRHR